MKKIFKFYEDPGHGWVAVKKQLLDELNISDKISNCSYIKGKTAYLEEDDDFYKFHNAFQAKYGIKPKYKVKILNNYSAIRGYKSFHSST